MSNPRQFAQAGSFEGFYLKHQNRTDTLALIPACHTDADGNRSASLQIITDKTAYQLDFGAEAITIMRSPFFVRLGGSYFSERGCRLSCHTPGLTLEGSLRYGPWAVPATDIMGPFRYVPFMQCRHSVLSMAHTVDGYVSLNGDSLQFSDGRGYIEGDRGHSFPRRYLWTQWSGKDRCILLSAAEIPLYGLSFTGCIGLVYDRGKELRIGTYRGARVLSAGPSSLLIRQGELLMSADLVEAHPQPLAAPVRGGMSRTVYESAAACVRYRLMNGERLLLDFTAARAGFESSWELKNVGKRQETAVFLFEAYPGFTAIEYLLFCQHSYY